MLLSKDEAKKYIAEVHGGNALFPGENSWVAFTDYKGQKGWIQTGDK